MRNEYNTTRQSNELCWTGTGKNILKGFNTKDKNNIGDAEKTVAKTKKTKKSYSPKDAPQDNDNIPIK